MLFSTAASMDNRHCHNTSHSISSKATHTINYTFVYTVCVGKKHFDFIAGEIILNYHSIQELCLHTRTKEEHMGSC